MTPVSPKAETAQRFDQHCAVPNSLQRFTLAPDALAHGQSWQAGKLAGVGPRHRFFHCSSERATRMLQSVFPPSPALGRRPRKRIAWLRHAPSRRKPIAPSEVGWWRSLSLALSAALARPSGGPPLARSSGRPSPAHAAWPWLGQRMVLKEIAALNRPRGQTGEALKREQNYFQGQAGRMNYRDIADRGWPIGSGAVESACRQSQRRFKGPGLWCRRSRRVAPVAGRLGFVCGRSRFVGAEQLELLDGWDLVV